MNTHELSAKVHDLEREHEIMREVLGCMIREHRLLAGDIDKLLPLGDIGVGLPETFPAKDIVKYYGNAVKAPKDPGSDARDTSRTQAVRNVEKLLKEGYSVNALTQASRGYGRSCDTRNVEWKHRLNAGNFFSKRAGFREWLPEGDAVVPDEKKAKEVEGLFGKDGE